MCQVGVVALGIYLFVLEHSVDEARNWTTLFVDAESEFRRSVLPGEMRDDPRRAGLLAAEQVARAHRDVRRRRRAGGADDGVGTGGQTWLSGLSSPAWASWPPTRTASTPSSRRCGKAGPASGSTRSSATSASACQVGGVPEVSEELKHRYFTEEALRALNTGMIYAGIAAVDCWRDAGFAVPEAGSDEVDWDTGAIIGTGVGGVDTVGEWVVPRVNEGKVRRLGSTTIEQTMASAVSACVGGMLALGGQVTTNSSACTTGTEAIVDAFHKVRSGRAARVIAGGAEGSSHYIWAGFDAMRVLARQSNDRPEAASRPMSASASGFVPSSGAGLLMVESLSSARARGARIYAEILGGDVNCGGQRGGGTMTAPNPEGARRCVLAALAVAGIGPERIEAINGHLTATMADPLEVGTWQRALGRKPEEFPWINSTKSLIGHGLGAAGGIESVACGAPGQPRVRPRVDQLRGRAPGHRPVRGAHPAPDDRVRAARPRQGELRLR